MDVERSEMNAVLHYLMMEIGYFYYNIKYTKDEEEQVEETRNRKTRRRRRRVKNRINPTSPIPDVVVNMPTVKSVKKVQPKNQQIIKQVNNPDDSWAASSPGPSTPVPEGTNNHGTKSAAKAKPKKKAARSENTTDNEAAASSSSKPSTRKKRSPRNNNYPKQKSSVYRRSSEASLLNPNPGDKKKPSRWNKTPEQIRTEWQIIFDGMFQQFITKSNPEDKWTFELIDVFKMREYQLKQKSIFKNPRALIGFHCSMCPNIWESLKGRVTFWIRQNNNRRSDGKLQGGHVFIFINGQKCQMCTESKEDTYENGDLNGDEIERVLSQLLAKIKIKVYGEKAQVNETGPSAEWRPKSEHKRELCQACFLGNCELEEEELKIPLSKN